MVVDRFDGPVALSFRNLPEVQVIKVGELNAYDVLCNDWIVFEQHTPAGDVPDSRVRRPASSPMTRKPATRATSEQPESC